MLPIDGWPGKKLAESRLVYQTGAAFLCFLSIVASDGVSKTEYSDA